MWKFIEGFEGLYEVSDTGEIRGVDRLGYSGQRLKGKKLRPRFSGKGYYIVSLRKNNKTYNMYIHQAVAKAFVPKREGCPIVNHKDGDKTNNRAENLEWVTYHENNQHAYDTKLKPCGASFYNAKLTEEQVREIRRIGKDATYKEIADKYGVSRAIIMDVLSKKTYKHIA